MKPLMHGNANSSEHEQFRELAAAAICEELAAEESDILEEHLHNCEECRSAFHEYRILSSEGFPLLAGSYEHGEETGDWNEAAARRRLLASAEEIGNPRSVSLVSPASRTFLRRSAWAASLAACLLAGVGVGTWRFGSWQGNRAAPTDIRVAELLSEKKALQASLASETGDLASL